MCAAWRSVCDAIRAGTHTHSFTQSLDQLSWRVVSKQKPVNRISFWLLLTTSSIFPSQSCHVTDGRLQDRNPADLAKVLKEASKGLPVELTMISNRGTLVWPGPLPATTRMDHWRCRFRGTKGSKKGEFADVAHKDIVRLSPLFVNPFFSSKVSPFASVLCIA
jgi:hypothetical protein